MATERNDLPLLFSRLADTLVRLFSERIDLARLELRHEAERVIRIAATLLLGAIAAAVGVVMLALAATDVLMPLVASRAWRMVIVGAPLTLLGARHLLRVARPIAAPKSATPDPAILAELDEEL